MNAATGAAAEAAKGNLPCLPFELLSGADQVCILYELLSKAGQSISFLLRSAMASSRSCAQTCAHVSLHAGGLHAVSANQRTLRQLQLQLLGQRQLQPQRQLQLPASWSRC